jgi:hypothetical protein
MHWGLLFSGVDEAFMSGLVVKKVERSLVYQGVLSPTTKRSPEPVYGVALLDCRGDLLGASRAEGLPGEVGMPNGVNLRTHDLRSYLGEDRGFTRPRRFPLVSAIWVHVRGERVRVGIYQESGAPGSERFDLDLGSIVAILSNQTA